MKFSNWAFYNSFYTICTRENTATDNLFAFFFFFGFCLFCVYLLMLCMCTCSVMSDSLWPPWTVSLPGLSVHANLQVRILECIAISFSRGSSWPRDPTHASCGSCISKQILYHWAPGKSIYLFIQIYDLYGAPPQVLISTTINCHVFTKCIWFEEK